MSPSFGTSFLSRVSSPTECHTSLIFPSLSAAEGGSISCLTEPIVLWWSGRYPVDLATPQASFSLMSSTMWLCKLLHPKGGLCAISLELGPGLLSWKADVLWELPLWFLSGRKIRKGQQESVILIAIRFSPNMLLLLTVKWCGLFIWRILDNPFVYWFS